MSNFYTPENGTEMAHWREKGKFASITPKTPENIGA